MPCVSNALNSFQADLLNILYCCYGCSTLCCLTHGQYICKDKDHYILTSEDFIQFIFWGVLIGHWRREVLISHFYSQEYSWRTGWFDEKSCLKRVILFLFTFVPKYSYQKSGLVNWGCDWVYVCLGFLKFILILNSCPGDSQLHLIL